MFRIMLVDDEPLILAGITSLLDWEANECQIVGKATSGQQALELMEETRPDIVITDIRMPAMDGIEFMRRARERGEDAQFILLTNLEEFNLAKEAMRLGAVDYLVKLELSEEKLVEAISHAKENRRVHLAANPGAADRGQSKAAATAEAAQKYFQKFLIYGTTPKVDEELRREIDGMYARPVLMMINFNYRFEDFSTEFTRADQKKVMAFAEEVIGEMAKGFFPVNCLVRKEQDGFVLIVSTEQAEDYQDKIRQLGGKLSTIIKDYFEAGVTLAVSSRGENIGEFSDLIYQCMSAMNYSYYNASQSVVFYSRECEGSERHSDDFNLGFMRKDLREYIRQNDYQGFERLMGQVADLVEECMPTKPQAINACSRLYYYISAFFEGEDDEAFPYAVNIMWELNRLGSLEQIVEWIKWFGERVSAVLKRRSEVRLDRNVELAMKYVREHYREKISQGQVADALKISQGYLSSIFKKHTGRSFTDYVNEVKIERAKELIGTHQYMMYEISDMLGYETQYYFSTVFKKVVGCTPKEYEAESLKNGGRG